MPEYGRSTGGVLNAVTKTGSNEFHGSRVRQPRPGRAAGHARTAIQPGGQRHLRRRPRRGTWATSAPSSAAPSSRTSSGSTWAWRPPSPATSWSAASTRWTSAPRSTRQRLHREDAADGLDASRRERHRRHRSSLLRGPAELQYIAKLTYLSTRTTTSRCPSTARPARRAARARFAFSARRRPRGRGAPAPPATLRRPSPPSARRTALRHRRSSRPPPSSTSAAPRRHRGLAPPERLRPARRTASQLGQHRGPGRHPQRHLAAARAPGPTTHHRLRARCRIRPLLRLAGPADGAHACPVLTYTTGGPGYHRRTRTLDRYQGKVMGTYLLHRRCGHHVIKAGVDAEGMSFYNTPRALPGLAPLRECTDGTLLLRRPQPVRLPRRARTSPSSWPPRAAPPRSTTIGGFVQDSWSVLDKVTLNVGVRYDAQTSRGGRQAGPEPAQPVVAARGRHLRPHPAGPLEALRQLRALLRERAAGHGRPAPSRQQQLAVGHATDAPPVRPARSRLAAGRLRHRRRPRRPSATRESPNQLWSAEGGDRVPGGSRTSSPSPSTSSSSAASTSSSRRARRALTYTRRYAQPRHRGHEPRRRQHLLHRQPGLRHRHGLPEGARATTTRSRLLHQDLRRRLAGAGELHVVAACAATTRACSARRPASSTQHQRATSTCCRSRTTATARCPATARTPSRRSAPRSSSSRRDMSVNLGISYRTPLRHAAQLPGRAPAAQRLGDVHPAARQRRPAAVGRTTSTRTWASTGCWARTRWRLALDVFNLFNFQQVTAVDQTFTFTRVYAIEQGGKQADVLGCRAMAATARSSPRRREPADYAADINPNFGGPPPTRRRVPSASARSSASSARRRGLP